MLHEELTGSIPGGTNWGKERYSIGSGLCVQSSAPECFPLFWYSYCTGNFPDRD